jgi:hypothetical protein
VIWTEPKNPYGKIIKYVVYYREGREKAEKSSIIKKELSVPLGPFTNPADHYSISVRAFTGAGGGNRSEPSIVNLERK